MKFKVKGSYTYKVEKIVEANNEQEAIDIALDSEPMCEWDSQDQDTYSEEVQSVEEVSAMSKFNFSEKDLKENGWEVLPDGVFFGFDLVDSHKTNIPTILSELIGFDSDAEGYDFLICAYRKEKSDE